MRAGKHVAFAIVAVVLSTALTLGLLLGADVYLHAKFAKDAGLNVWGYRGPVLGHKRPGERRVVVLGGSTAFGYGVTLDKAIPAVLERFLNERRRETSGGPVTVVNLGYNNEGAYAFLPTLRDYAYLDYDVVVLYSGYNDLGGHNMQVFRHQSPVFKLTGYLPILPIILQEKAMAIRYGGRLEAAYRSEKTQFSPNFTQRTTAAALEATVRISQSLEKQLGRLTAPDVIEAQAHDSACQGNWSEYCASVRAAIDYALSRGNRVIVVGQPYIADKHVEQQAVLEAMLRDRFGGNPRVKIVNLGRTVDLRDTTLAWDGMHLTAAGNERIARELVPVVLEELP